MFPEFDDATAKAAGWLTGLGGIAAALWKIRGWLKGDIRQEAAADRTDGGYAQIIAQQAAHAERQEARCSAAEARADVLETHMHALGQRITDEINSRYLAEGHVRRIEGENAGLRAQVESLRARVAELELLVHAKP